MLRVNEPPTSKPRSRTSPEEAHPLVDKTLPHPPSRKNSSLLSTLSPPSLHTESKTPTSSSLTRERLRQAEVECYELRRVVNAAATPSMTSTWSKLRNRLRKAELKRDGYQRAFLEKQARAAEERFRKEAGIPEGSASDAQRRLRNLDLERDAMVAASWLRRHTRGTSKAKCSCDLRKGYVEEAEIEDVPPQWDTPGWLDEMFEAQGFSPEVIVHGANTLTEMMAHDDNIKLTTTDLTIHKRSKPFAQGAMRVASYAQVAFSTDHYVAKSFKKNGKVLAHLAEDMRCQTLSKAFALEFNALVDKEHAFEFLVTTCLEGRSETSEVEYLSLEPHIPGDFVKYNGNNGMVRKKMPRDGLNKAAQAFSHFTFERSMGQLLVCDLQGFGNMLTDPAIHTLDPKRFSLAATNLNMKGFKRFFASHKCNAICEKLELQSTREMLTNDTLRFRTSWPTLDNTMCCSNKLCGMAISTITSRELAEFPDYHWCDKCWPQLTSSKVDSFCVAPGRHHEFNVSTFFYESQGKAIPRKCSKHHKKAAKISTTPVVSRGLWFRLKAATKNRFWPFSALT